MNELVKLIKKANIIWVCGNGGSAATAEHFTTDIIKKAYPAVCLNSNTSVITMIANDYGYENIFSHQLSILGREEDLLITISCSGKSKNILNAIHVAKSYDMPAFSFEKFGKEKDFGKLEDKHLAFAHAVAAKL